MSKVALLLWGIILCSGKSVVKCKTFYDVLQDKQQESIAASDKDFPDNFKLMIDLGTKLSNEYESRFSGNEPEKSADFFAQLDTKNEDIAEEEFIDQVFGNESVKKRAEWE